MAFDPIHLWVAIWQVCAILFVAVPIAYIVSILAPAYWSMATIIGACLGIVPVQAHTRWSIRVYKRYFE